MLATKPKTTKRTVAQLQAEAALELLRRKEVESGTLPLFREYPNDPVGWIEKHFMIPETPDHRTILEPYQKRCLRQALTKDANGNFPYSLILWSDLKKSIKSMIAAGVVLWMAWNTEWGSLKIIGNDLDQADSREAYYIRRAIELHPEMRKMVKITPSKYKIEFPNHAVIEAVPVDPSGEAGGNDDCVCYTELWAASNAASQKMWCFDDQTEILTKRGWVFGVDLLDSDIVAAFDDSTGLMQWEKPREIFKARYHGEMHLYESRTFSHCSTPDHRLYGKFAYSDKNGSLISGKRYNYTRTGIMRSNELRESGYSVFYPRTAINGFAPAFNEPEYKEFPGTYAKPSIRIAWSDWCEFMGWYLTEGNVKCNGGKPYTVCISQSPTANPEKWQIIKDCLTRCFGSSGFKIADKGFMFKIHFAPLARELFDMSGSFKAHVPEDIKESSPANLEKFLRTCILGDGTKSCGKDSWMVVTSSRLFADDLMEIGIKLGYSTSITSAMGDYSSLLYRANFAPGKDGYTRFLSKRAKDGVESNWKTVQDYDGIVWCPSVSTGLIIVRRHGKVCVSGNTESTLSPTKMGKSFRWVETYAGFTGKSPILERLWESNVKDGVRRGLQFPWASEFNPTLEVFENKASRTFALWNTTPRCPWQTDEYYRQEAATLLPSEFNRVHRNQWATASDAFVQPEWWDACKGGMIDHRKDDPHFMALDAAVDGDTFGLVMVSGGQNENYYVRLSRGWEPPQGGGHINFAEVEKEIRRLCEEYNIVEVCYDPYQLEDMSQRLRSDSIARMFQFSQGSPRLLADKTLRDTIIARRVHHDGDPKLREHVTNADAKTEGDKLRIVKRAQTMKIDLCVCLSMAVARAIYWRI